MTRLIKRYPNRRLYDTTESHYIKLEDLGTAVTAGEEIRVVDTKSGHDITRRVLLQVLLLDEHAHKLDCLPKQFLRTLIQLRDESLMRLFEHYVRLTLSSFTVAEQAVEKNMRLFRRLAPDPSELLSMLNPFARSDTTPDDTTS